MSHLTVPIPSRWRRMTASESSYGNNTGLGGFVDLQEMVNHQNYNRSRTYPNSFRPFTARKTSDSTSSTSSNHNHEFVTSPISPFHSEGWQTPDTPQTPVTPGKHMVSPKVLYSQSNTPVSRYNKIFHHQCQSAITPTAEFLTSQPKAVSTIPPLESAVELAGSLLLPSQGFPQLDPPTIPPRFDLSPRSSTDSNMSRSNGRQDIPILPPRQASLPRSSTLDRQLPIPLSQMTMEELMQILPKLDAAVIAQDWVPCMQKRQHELKQWLQKGRLNSKETSDARVVEQDLRSIVEESKDIAQTYYNLFEVAKELQKVDAEKQANAIDEAHAAKSEAYIALARESARHREQCIEYEREIVEVKDRSAQSIDVLSQFIQQNLHEAMRKSDQQQIHAVLDVLVQNQGYHSSAKVDASLYEDIQRSLLQAKSERNDLREVCKEQMAAIKDQTKELDSYVAKITAIITIVTDKEKEKKDLQMQIAQLKKQLHDLAIDTPPIPASQPSLRDIPDEASWLKEAEIFNLRRKLEKAYDRENYLQAQIRQLLQQSQEKGPGRIKRLLGHKSSPSTPSINSVSDLSQSHTPYHKDEQSPRQKLGTFQLLPAPRRDVEVDSTRRLMRNPSDEEIQSAVSGRFRFRSPTPGSGSERFGQSDSSSLASEDDPYEDRQSPKMRGRVLSGITEVTEDGASVKRNSSSPDAEDRRIYEENMNAARALGWMPVNSAG